MQDYGDKNENAYEYDFKIGKGWPYYKNLEYTGTPEAEPQNQIAQGQLPVPLDFSDRFKEEDSDDINLLYGHINKTLKTYVDMAMSGVSGALNLKTGREILDAIVDQVIEIAKYNHVELDALPTAGLDETWDKYCLLRALIESLALKEYMTCASRNSPVPYYETELEYSRYL